MVSVTRCLSSTIVSKDISSCINGWILTKLDSDDPYVAFINLIVLMVLFHFIHVSSSNGLKMTFELKKKIHKALNLDA